VKTRRIRAAVLAAVIAGAVCASAENTSVPSNSQYLRPAAAPAPDDNKPNAARITLGKALFFDPRLSGSNWISCATCHNPALGWSDGLATGIGHGMKALGRATPTIVNAAFNPIQMWDGRKGTLEEQALGPIEADAEMAQDIPGLVRKIEAIAGYRAMFAAAYPGEPVAGATIAKAIASFERTVLSTESPFDRWMKGDARAVGESVKRGFEVFRGRGNCATCHSGFNFTDNGFHNIGLRSRGDSEDVGRFAQRKLAIMRGAFKTPTLRDVALTAPYMHDGEYATLEDVVEHYARGGDATGNLSPNMKAIELSARDKSDLVAFLRSLTGAPMPMTVPRLPQ
jgi:cytochrome c peroxidase